MYLMNSTANFLPKLSMEMKHKNLKTWKQKWTTKDTTNASKMKYQISHEKKYTREEVQAATDKLQKGKASDNNGIRAEDIKTRSTKY